MPRRLQSWVGGRWVEGTGAATPLIDPSCEEVLAEATSGGLDLGAAVRHARERGLPALQELTFAQRGEMLQRALKVLHEHRDELLDLSTTSGGNTRGDAKFDVDGGINTLAWYAKLGEQLGAARWLVDGEGVQLGRTPRFWGQHLLVPRRGVAVHINAFNFPAWGLCEKAAVAWLAGQPVIVKPGTSTALLAHRLVEFLVAAQVLPEGALSCLVGSAGDLLDHLGPQDVVAFTGSSETAATLRRSEAVVRRGVRLNVEADSLNAAVLGPDVSDGDDTFDLFLKDVARELTQKAGQKCTAVRRIFVPAAQLAAAREALLEQLRQVKVGDPRNGDVRMGPLATAGQLRDVRAGLEELRGVAKAVHGDGGRGALVDVQGEKGYFMSPVLLEVEGDPAAARAVHAHEVFGPVATLLPYSGEAADAARLVGLGEGSLVASVYSDAPEFATELALGIAPWSGRVSLGSSKVGEAVLGPGAVMPQLVHGGPGRAGGGEELGSLRGLGLYLQRTAFQGYKPVLEKMAAGAPRA
jgi:oxepin-CoA hydrolase/3-oxo-5,6-dehydrosuberyl-CoA semialdehyde dehydrogenase